jgi:hypothetical protein
VSKVQICTFQAFIKSSVFNDPVGIESELSAPWKKPQSHMHPLYVCFSLKESVNLRPSTISPTHTLINSIWFLHVLLNQVHFVLNCVAVQSKLTCTIFNLHASHSNIHHRNNQVIAACIQLSRHSMVCISTKSRRTNIPRTPLFHSTPSYPISL